MNTSTNRRTETMAQLARIHDEPESDQGEAEQQASPQHAPAPARPRVPTGGDAKRDAISALIDGVTASLTTATGKARKVLDNMDENILAHGARIKGELDSFVHSAEQITSDADAMAERIDRLRAQHARMVNTRVSE